MCLNHSKYCVDRTFWPPEESLESKWIPNGVPDTIFNTFPLHLDPHKSWKCVQRACRKASTNSLIFEHPSSVQNLGAAIRVACLWGCGKTSHSEKSIAKHVGKPHFGNIAQTRAVRKGGLLRGKVSQGRPHPLRHSVKV